MFVESAAGGAAIVAVDGSVAAAATEVGAALVFRVDSPSGGAGAAVVAFGVSTAGGAAMRGGARGCRGFSVLAGFVTVGAAGATAGLGGGGICSSVAVSTVVCGASLSSNGNKLHARCRSSERASATSSVGRTRHGDSRGDCVGDDGGAVAAMPGRTGSRAP